MHEYSIAAEIVALVKQTAQGHKVTKITLNIGALSGIFSESLLMYMEIVLPEMGMDKVEIVTKETPATFTCTCGETYIANTIATDCPKCHGFERKITSGHDCQIESIEVEDE